MGEFLWQCVFGWRNSVVLNDERIEFNHSDVVMEEGQRFFPRDAGRERREGSEDCSIVHVG